MTRWARQTLLTCIAALFAATLAIFLLRPEIARRAEPPVDLDSRALWISRHPADWLVASAISVEALDALLPRRHELWRSSYELAHHLAPRRRNPAVSFVRGGLIHWHELEANDRASILRVAAPLLRDPQVFGNLHAPLWELTRDFGYLRRNAPDTVDALESLRILALSRGLFAEYRRTRDAVLQKRIALFEQRRSTSDPPGLLALLPRKLTTSEEPLIRGILHELQQRSFAPREFGDPMPALIDYAIRHELRPLDPLMPFAETPEVLSPAVRARLALALDKPDTATLIELGSVTTSPDWARYFLERALFHARRGDAAAADLHLRRASAFGVDIGLLATAETIASALGNEPAATQFHSQLRDKASQPVEWRSTCAANELCEIANTTLHVSGDSFVLDMTVVQSDQSAPYVEIYVDDARAAEGDVSGERRFVVPATPGVHQVELRLMNPRMGNGAQRRVRLS